MSNLRQINLLQVDSTELNWNFDFSPTKTWTNFLPLVALRHENQLIVVTGFERKNSGPHWVLEVEGSIKDVFNSLYPFEGLGPLENLRLNELLGDGVPPLKYLLDLPIELQKFFDLKQVPLKTLKPLEHLKEWHLPIKETFLELKPSSSQVREILDLLCDLKFLDLDWADCAPDNHDVHQWLLNLNKKRNPLSNLSDNNSKILVQKTPWPRGVRAKWERQGDQGAIHIQARVTNPKEFENLKTSLNKIHLEEKLWNF